MYGVQPPGTGHPATEVHYKNFKLESVLDPIYDLLQNPDLILDQGQRQKNYKRQ
jgi:hypothetical protein